MNKEELKNLIDLKLSQYDIAKKLGKSQTTVRYWLTFYGLSTIRTNPLKERKLLYCINCLIPLSHAATIRGKSKYCSAKCQQSYHRCEAIKNKTYSINTAKKYLLSKGAECSICKLMTWNGSQITLELDHIDGKHDNKELTNLRLICPNCHSQTPTYKSKNKGNGRQKRRDRYRDGKSW